MDKILMDLSGLISELDQQVKTKRELAQQEGIAGNKAMAEYHSGGASALELTVVTLRLLLAKHMKGYGQ